jgi:hypothetical protein
VSGIDWQQSLATYAHPNWVGEEEITMLPDAVVTLVSITKREGWFLRTSDAKEEDVPLHYPEGQELPLKGDWARGLRP